MLYDKPYVFLPTNLSGRDFAIGDLRGQFDTLRLLLDAVNFDPLRDRLFSTGNLFDAEPETLECLELAEEPWFFPVLGAGEAFLLQELISDAKTSAVFSEIRHSLETHPEGSDRALGRICEILNGLPMAFEVSLADGTRVGLSHASVPVEYHWDQVRQLVRRPEVITDCASRTLESGLLWSMSAGMKAYLSVTSDRFRHLSREELEREERWAGRASAAAGIDLVVAGGVRMPLGQPVQLNNRLFLHTGAGEPDGVLSLVQLGTWNCWKGTPAVRAIAGGVAASSLNVLPDEQLQQGVALLKKYDKLLERL